jgi:hypothetical protein
MVIGGQAVLLYGEPRLTRDIDIALGVDIDEFGRVLAAVQTAELKALVDDAHEFARRTNVLPLVDSQSNIRVDLIFSFSSYEHEAIRRAHSVRIGDTDVNYASIEDLIIHKMVAGRPRDIEDVRGILVRNSAVDLPYIRKWLEEFVPVVGRNLPSEFDILNTP